MDPRLADRIRADEDLEREYRQVTHGLTVAETWCALLALLVVVLAAWILWRP